ncbi:MAG: hypothetical protein VCF08_21350 [Alphaproteobacteria bacterium]
MDDKHWLERPATIAKLWRGGWVLLAILILAEFTYHPHAYFVLDGWFAFHAVFGLLSCIAMVLFAKLLGVYLKRGEEYYDRD